MATLSARAKLSLPEGDPEAPIRALAGRITTRPPVTDITEARSTLAQTIATNESSLHSIAESHTSAIAHQLDQNLELNQRSDAAQREARALADEFDVTSLDKVADVETFRRTASNLQASHQQQALANTTAGAIQDLKRRYDLLVRVEDGVWAGMGADPSTVAALTQLGNDGQRNGGATVQMALAARCAVLRTMVAELLSNAWNQSVTIASVQGLPSVKVLDSTTLSAPKGPRSTPYTKTSIQAPSYSLAELCNALDSLKVLPGLLHDLHNHIMRTVVEPMLEHDTWRPTDGAGEGGATLETTVVPAQDHLGVVRSVKAVLDFFTGALPQSCQPLNLRLQESAFNLTLSRLLIPNLPTALSSLPEWLHLALQGAEWETSMRPDGSKDGVLRAFLDHEAGTVWLQKRREASLCQARRVAYERWSPWDSKPVKSDAVQQTPPRTASETVAKEDDDDGWGFDEAPQPTSSSREGTPSVDAEMDGGNDGWDFDNVVPTPAPPVVPAPSRNVPKPREAKRLGKKATSKGARQGSSPSPSPPPPPVPKNIAPPVPSLGQAGPHTSTPEAPVFSGTFKVSLAADAALDLASAALDELVQISSLEPAVSSFRSVPRGLSEQLAEALDLIRVSVPVAQTASIQGVPMNLVQLSNDYKYLGSKLETLMADVEWVDRSDTAHRFSTASSITLEVFVAGQTTALAELLSRAHDFTDTANPNSFMQVEQAVHQLAVYLTDTATRLATMVNAEVYHTVLGKLLEYTVTSILGGVVALEDITELESERIGGLLSTVETLASLFQHDHAHVSTVAAFVPHWIKFGYLNELLRAKLVEITHLYDNGSLVDFTPAELGGLVRALFADSPQRATLLDKIKM